MIILGINDGRHHNSAASIVIDGVLIASVEEERISRIKMDSAYPHQAIAEVLSIAGITDKDVDIVALANLSRLDQKPYLDRLYYHIAKAGKQDPEIRWFFWKRQPDRLFRLLKRRKKPAGVLSQKPTQTVEHRHMPHQHIMHRPLVPNGSALLPSMAPGIFHGAQCGLASMANYSKLNTYPI